MRRLSLDKVAFVLSVAALSFLYGIATQAFGWFPSDLIRRAWNQAEAISPVSTAAVTGERGAYHWQSERVYPDTGVTTASESSPPDRSTYTLISSVWNDFGWNPGLKLINGEGQSVHTWQFRFGQIFGAPNAIVHGSHLFPDGDVLFNISNVGTVRMDACGEVLWTLALNGHHSIDRADDGSFWIPGTTDKPQRHSVWKVDGPGAVYQDLLLHVSESGDVIEKFNVVDILSSDDRLRPYLSQWQSGDDPIHLNDIEVLGQSQANEYPLFRAGDLLLSAKHLNLIFVWNPDSGIKWFSSRPFIQQHDPDFIGDGWIGVFDNHEDGTYRGTVLGGSRIFAFQPHTDSTKILYPQNPDSVSFHTPNMGNWQKLTNGNLLLTESRAGRVLEVTETGRKVWEWIVTPFNDESVPEVYEAARYDLTEKQIDSWPCSPGDSIQNR